MADFPIINDIDDASKQPVANNLNNLSIVLSTKQSGYYSSLASPANITIYPEDQGGSPGSRIYIDIPVLKNAPGLQQIAHGLTYTRSVLIGGTADDIVAKKSLPLPYASATAADVVEVYLDDTYINIVVGKDMSAYAARICIEYIEY